MDSNRFQLEICCGDLESVAIAVDSGANRVELCSSLATGGLTPSAGRIRNAVNNRKATAIHVLIRPREGDFLYSPDEIDTMLTDIDTCRRLGAQGIVIGALNADGSVDTETCRKLIDASGSMSVTFHRAFDLCNNPQQAMEQIIALGCDRILTSGCAPTALDGVDTLANPHRQAAGRIKILAGSGVNPANAAEIVQRSGVRELHASARSPRQSLMKFRHEGVAMGSPESDEYTRMVTDQSTVISLLNILNTL